ncbi:excisionase [Escherichia coli]
MRHKIPARQASRWTNCAGTGFGKTFIYDRIKSGDLPKAKVIHGRARWLYRDHCEFKNKLLSRANG